MGEEFVLTIRDPARVEGRAIGVSYDAFIDDVQVRWPTPAALQRWHKHPCMRPSAR